MGEWLTLENLIALSFFFLNQPVTVTPV